MRSNWVVRKVMAALACLLFLSGCYNDSGSRQHILKIYNWADYIGEGVLEDFMKYYKEQTGEDIEIVYQTFDINEIMLTKIERGHEDFDVVCPSEYIIERMLRKNMLLPIDTAFGNSPNYIRLLAPYIRKQIDRLGPADDPASRYAVCYMWGTAGILYNKKFVTGEEVQSWGCLWDPKYKGKLLMKDAYRDAYGTALLYANRDKLTDKSRVPEVMNDYSPEAMATVEEYLKRLKPNIAGWEADFGKEMMTKNKAWINMTWSGDAQWAIEEAKAVGVDLDYLVPSEGSNIWFDGWVIPKYAKNVKAASYFINFLCRPDIAIRNMEENGYVSSVASPEILEYSKDPEAKGYSDASYFFGPEARRVKVNQLRYPDIKVIERCAMIRDFGDRTPEVLEIWSRVKGDNLGTGIVVLIFVVAASLSGWQIYRRIRRARLKKKQHRRRKRRR